MPRFTYEVHYHLICAVHFSADHPSGSDLAQIWTSLAALGTPNADISFVCKEDNEPTTLKGVRLGGTELAEVLVSSRCELLTAGASVVRPDAANAIFDSDVNFGYSHDGVWDGQQGPPTLTFSVSGQVLESTHLPAVLGTIRAFFNIADRRSPLCGLVDLARPDDAFAGMVYDTTWPRAAPLARWLGQLSWTYSGSKKGDRLRGLFWGNYLGPNVLKRMGGHEKAVEACQRKMCSIDGTPNAHCWSMENGLFVSLSSSPLDCRPGHPFGLHPVVEANLKWLVRELGVKGILNQW